MTRSPDIFISIRDSTLRFAQDIGEVLDEMGYTSAWMGKLTGGPAGERYVDSGVDYQKAYEELIDAAPLTLVLICSQRGLQAEQGNSRCIQKDEIVYSVKRDLQRGRTQTPTHTLLVFTPGQFADNEQEAITYLNRQLSSIGSPGKIQQFHLKADPDVLPREYKRQLRKFAEFIFERYDGCLRYGHIEAKPAKLPATNPNMQPHTHPRASVADSDPTLDTARFDTWLSGELTAGPDEGPGYVRESMEAFAFDPARFMPLAVEGAAAAEGAATKNQISVFDAIFKPSPHPLMIRAPTGAGKTTTLATAAALAATPFNSKFAAAFRGASQTHAELFEQVGELVAARAFLPVTVSAADLAEKLLSRRQASGDDPNSNTALSAIEALSAYNAASLAKVGEQPILLLVDGMDEAGAQRNRILKDLVAIHADQENDNPPLRVVMTARSSQDGDNGDGLLTLVNLQGPRDEDIEHFIRAYLSRLHSSDSFDTEAPRKRLLKEAESMKARTDTSEIVRSPLLLNAYCWVRAREEEDGLAFSRAVFCRRLVHRMLQDAGVKVGGRPFPSENLIQLLRTLAYRMVLAGGTLTTARATSALLEAAGKHRYAAFSRGEDPAETASDLLRLLRVQVGFVRSARVAGEVEIAPRLLADYLAAEYVFEQGLGSVAAEIEKLLSKPSPKPSPERIADLEPLLGFWMSLPLNALDARRGQEALEIPRALLERACQERGADNLSEAMAWFAAACRVRDYCVGAHFTDDEETMSQARELEQAAIDFYKSVAPMLDDGRKVRAIDALATMWLTDDPERTRLRIHQLLDELAGRRPDWLDIGVTSDCGGRLEVAARPVLVCDYEEYLAAPKKDASVGWLDERARNDLSIEGKHVRRTFKRRRPPIEKWALMSQRLAAPVTYLTWVEAVHYALWRDKAEGETICIRLPTEPEWRRISQICADDKRYAWRSDQLPSGGASPAPHRGLKLDGPVPPGVFPAPDGMPFDFGTNVATWLIHGDGQAPDWPPPGTEPESVKHIGGRWNKALQEARASTSNAPATPAAHHPNADDRFIGVGLRLVRVVRQDKENLDGA